MQYAVLLARLQLRIVEHLHAEEHRLLEYLLALVARQVDELTRGVDGRDEVLEHVVLGLDVLDRVVLEQVVVLVRVAHERIEDLLHDDHHVLTQELPRERRHHAVLHVDDGELEDARRHVHAVAVVLEHLEDGGEYLDGVGLEEVVGELDVLLAGVGGRAVAVEHAIEDADGPLLDLPPRALGLLLHVDEVDVLGHRSAQYHVAHLDPVGRVLLVHHVQRQHELYEGEEDLEYLFLGEHAQVGLIVAQLTQALEEHGQEDAHGLVIGLAVLGRLVLVDLAHLVEGLQGAVPRVYVRALDELVHLLHNRHPLVRKVVLRYGAHAHNQLRADLIGRVYDRLDQVVAYGRLVRLVQAEGRRDTRLASSSCQRLRLAALVHPVLADHVLQVDGARLTHRHLHLVGHDELKQARAEAEHVVNLEFFHNNNNNNNSLLYLANEWDDLNDAN